MRRKHKPTRIRSFDVVPSCVPYWWPRPADTPDIEEPDGIIDVELCDGGAELNEGK